MFKNLSKLCIAILILLFSCSIATSQTQSLTVRKRNVAAASVEKTAQIAFVVVKETAKVAWKTTKFTAGEIAAPVAKAIVVKAAPKVSLFVLKQSGNLLEKGAPIAAKLLLTYLKL